MVAGLTLAGASAVSHDLYANVFRKGATERQELKVSKITVLIAWGGGHSAGYSV